MIGKPIRKPLDNEAFIAVALAIASTLSHSIKTDNILLHLTPSKLKAWAILAFPGYNAHCFGPSRLEGRIVPVSASSCPGRVP